MDNNSQGYADGQPGIFDILELQHQMLNWLEFNTSRPNTKVIIDIKPAFLELDPVKARKTNFIFVKLLNEGRACHDLRIEGSSDGSSPRTLIPRLKQIFSVSRLVQNLEIVLIDDQRRTKFNKKCLKLLLTLNDLKHLKLSVAMTYQFMEAEFNNFEKNYENIIFILCYRGRIQGRARGRTRNHFFLQKWTGQNRTGDIFLVFFRTSQHFLGVFFEFY